jgi:membrane-bound metal-dependent hydrolase YbcI (DUF457 family)
VGDIPGLKSLGFTGSSLTERIKSMRGYTHALIGATTVVVVNSMVNFIQPHPVNGIPTGVVICLGAAVLGALVPDIDTEEDSMIKRELGLGGAVASFGLRLFGVQHRGLTHYGIVSLLVTLFSNMGSGFCFVNDICLGILLLKKRFKRIACKCH